MPDTDTYSEDDLLSLAAAAKVARVSRSTLLRAESAEKITSLRTPGGHRRFRRADVEALLSPTAPAGDAK